MKTLTTPQEIKEAVSAGKKVYEGNYSYQVIKDSKDQFLIRHTGGYCIGLTGMEGTKHENKLNGSNFFTDD